MQKFSNFALLETPKRHARGRTLSPPVVGTPLAMPDILNEHTLDTRNLTAVSERANGHSMPAFTGVVPPVTSVGAVPDCQAVIGILDVFFFEEHIYAAR